MKTVYLDTNIILCHLRKEEDYFEDAQIIRKQKHLKFVTGTITLVEISSVLSRLMENMIETAESSLKEKIISVSNTKQIQLLVDYLINYTSVEIIEEPEIELFNLFQKRVKINLLYKLAISHSSKVKMKTLDNIHFATARYYESFLQNKISYLVTADDDFIKKGKNYREHSEILIIHPRDFVSLECE